MTEALFFRAAANNGAYRGELVAQPQIALAGVQI